jgi:hypothetical protein
MRSDLGTASPAENDESLLKLTELFRDVFEDQAVVLQPEITADDRWKRFAASAAGSR